MRPRLVRGVGLLLVLVLPTVVVAEPPKRSPETTKGLIVQPDRSAGFQIRDSAGHNVGYGRRSPVDSNTIELFKPDGRRLGIMRTSSLIVMPLKTHAED